MEYRELHPWGIQSVPPARAIQLQTELAKKIVLSPAPSKIRLIAGADISYERFSDLAYAGFVVLDASTLQIVATSSAEVRMDYPYIPGLLTFREAPALLAAWKQLKVEPDVVCFDGQGIAHPRRLGIASHLGLLIDRPSIGCGKSLLTGTFQELGDQRGDFAPLMHRGEKVGVALRTKARTQPVFVSVGHRMILEDAIAIVLSATRGYRIPEPTRQAHLFVNQLRREGTARLKGAA